jgi:Reverse transcriptase (RNA-dependent DNA polymerase)
VYGQKQAGRVWNEYLVEKLTGELGFKQSKFDECVFFRGSVMYVLYTDDSILAGPSEKEIEQAIEDIKRVGLNITVEGDLQDFLGINIERKSDGTIHLTQPHLIDQVLEDLRLAGEETSTKSTPAASSKLLSNHDTSEDFDNHFHYRSVIGKLNYLERGTRPDIAYIVHQCARFAAKPKKEHALALKWLGRYLKGTRDKGMILRPLENKDLEVYVDADFAGNWNPAEGSKRDTARSRHGYIIAYAGVPISWKSQLQGEIALSSTESEYTGLSYALREAIPIMGMLKEMKSLGFPIRTTKSKVHCRVFEDNSGALEMAKIHKYRPRTKHICTKLHHFRDYVLQKQISIHPIDTKLQPADFLTKPLNEDILLIHRKMVMGW